MDAFDYCNSALKQLDEAQQLLSRLQDQSSAQFAAARRKVLGYACLVFLVGFGVGVGLGILWMR